MTQPIDRETAIALAKEAGMAGMLTDVVCSLEEIHRLCNLAVAHSRKDAEPVEYFGCEPWEKVAQTALATMIFPSHAPDKPFVALGDCVDLYPDAAQTKKLYAPPPEADKLLQQALEALERATGYLWAGTTDECNQDAVADVRLHKKTITAIRTYRENKA